MTRHVWSTMLLTLCILATTIFPGSVNGLGVSEITKSQPSSTVPLTTTPPADQPPADTIALFTAGTSNNRRLYALAADGSLADLGHDIQTGAVASRSGRWIASAGLQPGDPVVIINLETGTTLTIPTKRNFWVFGMVFDAAETRLAFLEVGPPGGETSARWAVVIVSLEDGSTIRFEETRGPDSVWAPGHPIDWSASGDELLIWPFWPYTEAVYVGVSSIALPPGPVATTVDTLDRRVLLPGGTAYRSSLHLSPDAKYLLYLARDLEYTPAGYEPVGFYLAVSQLWALNLVDGTTTLLLDVTDGGALGSDAAWSPDATQILFAQGNYDGDTFASLMLRVRDGSGTVRNVGLVPLPQNGHFGSLAWCTPDIALSTVSTPDGMDQLHTVDLSSGSTTLVTSADSISILGCMPPRGPSIRDFLTRKQAVLTQLEQTSVDILGLSFPITAYNEAEARTLVQRIQEGAESGSLNPDQVEAFARLTVQEEGLAELLPLYSQTSADLTEVGADVVGILLSLNREADRALEACYTSGNPFSGACLTLRRLIDRQVLRIINSLVRLAIRFIPDPHQQEEFRDFWMLLIDSIMLQLDAGDTVQDILLSTVVKGPAVSLLVHHYVGAVQPSLDQGVRSADPTYAGSEPTWSVEGQLEPAELHIEGIVEQATIRAEHAHSVHQDLMRGADLAQLLTDIADLGQLSPWAALARIVAIATRVEHFFVDVTAIAVNFNSTRCTRYLSTRAGSLAFNPNQPGENCEYIGDSSRSSPRMAREYVGGGNATAWEPVWSHAMSGIDTYEEAVTNLLAAMRSGDAGAITEALTTLDEADQALGSSTDQAMSVILNSDVPDSAATEALSRSNRFSLDALELYLLVASYVTAPEDERSMAEVEQAASTVLSSLEEYGETLQAAAPTGTEDRALPIVQTIVLPDEAVVEEPFEVTVAVRNVGSADASAVAVRAQATGQEVQVAEIGTLGINQTYTATLQAQGIHTGTLTLLIEVAMGDSVTDNRMDQVQVGLESPEPEEEEKEETPGPQPGCCAGLWGLIALPAITAILLLGRRSSFYLPGMI